MARTEADREDPYEEFRSATRKWELSVKNEATPVVLGVRKDNRLSLYFGADPCFHYDAHNRLLRAFKNGALYRTQGDTLAQLIRTRTPETTTLNRTNLTPDELTKFLSEMTSRIDRFMTSLEQKEYRTLRTNSDEQQLVDATKRLQKLTQSEYLLAPAYPTKRK